MKRTNITIMEKEEEVSTYEIPISEILDLNGLGREGTSVEWEIAGESLIVRETILLGSKKRNVDNGALHMVQ